MGFAEEIRRPESFQRAKIILSLHPFPSSLSSPISYFLFAHLSNLFCNYCVSLGKLQAYLLDPGLVARRKKGLIVRLSIAVATR